MLEKMLKTALLVTAMALVLPSPSAFAGEPTHAALREELLQMKTRDQEVRNDASKSGDLSKWRETDAANQKRLKEIVEQYGWPTFAMVGPDGGSAAWLLAQHSDKDKTFQLKVLALMEPLVKNGQASATDYAYLHDRTHYPQRYGTQGTCVTREEWQPLEIEDIDHVNERRRALGLSSMAEYAALFKEICGNSNIGLGRGDQRTVPVPKS